VLACALAILVVGGTATALTLRAAGRDGAAPRWSPPNGRARRRRGRPAKFVGWSDPTRVGQPYGDKVQGC
jgi:hypothetical protein